jgi:alpha-mannosidase
LLGRTFFRETFGAGVESPVLWLPDVFGYAWNLPQLIKQAGLDYFFTIKISWNQYNRVPYESFWWQGLDGTRVLTHFSTSPEHHSMTAPSTYNAEVDSKVTLATWLKYQQKHLHNEILMSYGWGDGGGGATREMIENIRELDSTPSLPQVRQSRVIDFFRRLEVQAGDKLPVWNGELYLEGHRGTYTTQAFNKQANRSAEFSLHNAEFLATVASLFDETYQYPHETFKQAWELVCLHQFHDIIPGSSIGEVYADSRRYYDEIRSLTENVYEHAVRVISGHIGGDAMLINPSGAFCDEAVYTDSITDGTLNDAAGNRAAMQFWERGHGAWSAFAGGVLPYTLTGLRRDADNAPVLDMYERAPHITATPECLDNGRVRVELNAAGDITRIFYHDTGREILPEGAVGNQFQAFEDRPNNWDAWDIDVFFEDRMTLAQPADSIRVTESGDLCYTLEIKRRILNSEYTQTISLQANTAHIDFSTVINWRERHTLLKVAFPVDVLATKATHEVQFGNVERPTTRNMSWDWAKFETCAQKWVLLQEGNFGVALINDGKYGHDVKDNVIRLSLLRSPTSPDPDADQGLHAFGYRLQVDVDLPSTVQSAYNFNNPPVIVSNPVDDIRLPRSFTFVENLSEHVLVYIETIKRAQDDHGVIVRLYEYGRTRGHVTLDIGFPVREAYMTSILEENQAALDVIDRARVIFPITPFQVVTLRLIPEKEAAL